MLLEVLLNAHLRDELNTHLALQALFTYSSPGCNCYCYKLFPFQAHWGRWHCTSFLGWFVYLQFMWEVGLPPSPVVVFLPPPLLQAFPLLVAGRVPLLLPSPAGLFIHSSVGDCPTLFAMCLFCCCLLFSFFFPWVGVGLSRGLCWSGPGLSVGVLRTT
jgi:hypothetical protein